MCKALSILAGLLIAASTAPAAGAAPNGLSFRDLEYQQPRDPLLPSNQSANIVEHSSVADLAAATDMLSSVMPTGTPREMAVAILRRAGARCHPLGGEAEACSYFDVETRDEYVDAVHWNVRLQLAGDRVNGFTVDRSWVRD